MILRPRLNGETDKQRLAYVMIAYRKQCIALWLAIGAVAVLSVL